MSGKPPECKRSDMSNPMPTPPDCQMHSIACFAEVLCGFIFKSNFNSLLGLQRLHLLGDADGKRPRIS
jgi:hypothetical protein